MAKYFWRCAHWVIMWTRIFLTWLSDKLLDCQLYCSRRTGWDPF